MRNNEMQDAVMLTSKPLPIILASRSVRFVVVAIDKSNFIPIISHGDDYVDLIGSVISHYRNLELSPSNDVIRVKLPTIAKNRSLFSNVNDSIREIVLGEEYKYYFYETSGDRADEDYLDKRSSSYKSIALIFIIHAPAGQQARESSLFYAFNHFEASREEIIDGALTGGVPSLLNNISPIIYKIEDEIRRRRRFRRLLVGAILLALVYSVVFSSFLINVRM